MDIRSCDLCVNCGQATEAGVGGYSMVSRRCLARVCHNVLPGWLGGVMRIASPVDATPLYAVCPCSARLEW